MLCEWCDESTEYGDEYITMEWKDKNGKWNDIYLHDWCVDAHGEATGIWPCNLCDKPILLPDVPVGGSHADCDAEFQARK